MAASPGSTPWRILHVDDDPDWTRDVREYLEGEELPDGSKPVVTPEGDLAVASERLQAGRFDLAILDVRREGLGEGSAGDDEDAGRRVLETIQSRTFVPIIFFTALPAKVAELKSPAIGVVEKTEGMPALLAEVRRLFATGFPLVNRALEEHLAAVQRDYMWSFVVANWDEIAGKSKRGIAHLLARRLALSLSGAPVVEFGAALGAEVEVATDGQVPPEFLYIVPPLENPRLVGEILHGEIDGEIGYWIVLTPSCDLVQGSVERVLVAKCNPIEAAAEYKAWTAEEAGAGVRNNLTDLLRNSKRDRFVFLPAAMTVPGLVVDLQDLRTTPSIRYADLTRVASLDSPYAEFLVSRFTRYFSRIGTPELDTTIVLRRLAEDRASLSND